MALALALSASAARAGQDLAPYVVADPAAQEITRETLLAQDRFWPAMVTLRAPFRPFANAGELEAGRSGVLVRVETSRLARVDFGRDGLLDVPIEKTDLVEVANAVRRGEVTKTAPNFVLAIGSRLVDTRGERPAPFSFQEASRQLGFLAVYADPASPRFADVARELAPLASHPGVLTVLFPQGRAPDPRVWEALLALEWRIPFVLAHLSEPYTRVLLRSEQVPPFVTLQTADGRLLLGEPWRPGSSAAIERGLALHFPERSPAP